MKKRTSIPALAGLLVLFLATVLLICAGNVKAAGKTPLKNTAIRLSKTVYTYNGKVQKPSVTVRYKGKKLKINKDYTLTYSKGRKNPGLYTVTVKGTGSYTGMVKKTFRINPVGAKLATMTSPAGGTTLKLTWKRPSRAVSGYQIRYSTRKDFKSAKVQTISGATKLTTTLKSLKPGTRYYLEIRTFYRYTKTKSTYSAWSKMTAKTTAKKAGSSNNGGTADDGKNNENTNNGNTNNGVKADPLKLVNASDASVKATVGTYFSIQVNNCLKSAAFSKPDILNLYGDFDKILPGQESEWDLFYDEVRTAVFIPIDPGKVTVTLTDIYDQKLTVTVNVGQKMYGKDKAKDVFQISTTQYDASLPVPEVASAFYGSASVYVNALGTFQDSDSYMGYEYWLSTTPDFSKEVKMAYTAINWNGLGYGRADFYSTKQGTVYYTKVRSYKISGTTKLYGSWSSVKKVSIGDYKNPVSSGKNQYSYELYYLDDMGSQFYTKTLRTVYIKTANPDPSSILLTTTGENSMVSIESDGGFCSDIDYLDVTDNSEFLHKVEGGYVAYIEFQKSGTYPMELREIQEKGYVTVKKFQWTVKDYLTAVDEWIDEVIAKNTTSSMTSMQKIDAVSSYLRETFRYSHVYKGNYVHLAKEPEEPFFLTHRWDSLESPAVLRMIAEKIGGFDEIYLYAEDSTLTKEEYDSYHSCVRLRQGTEEKVISVCPTLASGMISTITKIDFTNTAAFQPVQS